MQQMLGITINAESIDRPWRRRTATTPRSNQINYSPNQNDTLKLEIAFEPIFKVKIISFILCYYLWPMPVSRALHHNALYTNSLNGCKSHFYIRFMNEKLELEFHQSGLSVAPINLICISFALVPFARTRYK